MTQNVSLLRNEFLVGHLKRPVAELLIIAFVSNLVAISIPLLITLIIDKVIVHQDIESLVVLSVALTIVVIFESSLTYLKNKLFNFFTTKITVAFAEILYRKLYTIPLLNFKNETVGELITKLQAVTAINGLVTNTVLVMVVDAGFLLIFLSCLVVISPSLTIGSFILVCIFGLISFYFAVKVEKHYDVLFFTTSRHQSLLVETVFGMETIRTLNIADKTKAKLSKALTNLLGDDYERRNTSNVQEVTALFMHRSSGLFVICYGALLVIKGDLSLGQLVGFQLLLGMLHAPLQRIAFLTSQYKQVKVAIRRANDFFALPAERTGDELTTLAEFGSFELKNVGFTYPGKKDSTLQSINLNIAKGEHVAIVGLSGSGKSTLAKLLGAIVDPSEGQFTYNGIPSTLLPPNTIRGHVAHASQDSVLFAGSILENIRKGRENASTAEVLECVRAAGVSLFADDMEWQLLSDVGERGGSLSGGQKQRVVLARELLRNAEVLLLDEATNAIDKETEVEIFDAIQSRCRARNCTFIFVTHNPALAQRAEVIVRLDEGKACVERVVK